jgi:hypothetical protein
MRAMPLTRLPGLMAILSVTPSPPNPFRGIPVAMMVLPARLFEAALRYLDGSGERLLMFRTLPAWEVRSSVLLGAPASVQDYFYGDRIKNLD